MSIRSVILLAVTLCIVTPVRAHEFWLTPVNAPVAAGGTARLDLRVGEYFDGELLGFSRAQTLDLRHFSSGGNVDLRTLLPPNAPVPALLLPLSSPGTHMVIFNSHPSTLTLSADTFHAYLHEEGLSSVKAQREAAGIAATPGRERFRRFVKTLIQVAPDAGAVPGAAPAANAGITAGAAAGGMSGQALKPDTTYSTVTGQRLEIVPYANPLTMLPGSALKVGVLFDGKPLSGALLKAWHRRGDQTLIIRATTATDGSAAFDLPYTGPWMISMVHMVPVVGAKDVDWDSFWGNLTFSVLRSP